MMKRCTIEDNALVCSILGHPSIYPWVTDDSAPPLAFLDYTPFLALDAVYVLMPRPGCLTIFMPINGVTWEVHSAALPESRGDTMMEAAREALAWMFENTPCRKVVTCVPSFNSLALRLAKQIGMVPEGVNRRSFLKDGVIYNQTLLGICKEELLCRQ